MIPFWSNGLHHQLLIGEELPPPEGDTEEERARTFTLALTERIEDIVRQYPDQWHWFHQRWKRQPVTGAEGEQVTQKSKKARLKGDPYVRANMTY